MSVVLDDSVIKSEVRNAGPIVSIAMMIRVAFGGGGVVVSVVSVLCGAGGGLTVQLPTRTIDAMSTTPRAI